MVLFDAGAQMDNQQSEGFQGAMVGWSNIKYG